MDKKRLFVDTIMYWWEHNRRDFPWRKTDDPYTILVTEILLRKTTAGHANIVHEKFFIKYPKIEDLANAKQKELAELIKPLGLANQRSKQLISLAKIIKTKYNGKIPCKSKLLLELPGVGRYTASGVRCIACKKDEPMVDTNVVKIIGRYFGYEFQKKPAYNDPGLWDFVKGLIPPGKCKEFNLGLIDFVSAVCTSKKPKCEKCPFDKFCEFRRSQE